jgi:CHAD domain-containing protein
MATDAKWIGGLKETTPAVEAAQRVLKVRLKAVLSRLPQAMHEAQDDVEHVHQLRVSTRRAGAALRIFEDLLPRKALKRLRKKLRRVRRAAAEARDWDVFLNDAGARLAAAPATHRPGLDLVVGIAHGQRSAAQVRLAEGEEPPLDLQQAIDEALDGLRLPDELPKETLLRDVAALQLGVLLSQLDDAAAGDLTDYEHLHQVRIIGKRLRYAMEVFESCFAASFREVHYPAIEEMQDILGLANDSHVALGQLEEVRARVQGIQPEHWKRYHSGVNGLIKFHQQRLPRQRRQFEQWLRHWQRSGGAKALLQVINSSSKTSRQDD